MKDISSVEISRRQAFARILSWQRFRLFQHNRPQAAIAQDRVAEIRGFAEASASCLDRKLRGGWHLE
jgi:hypothetical protein